MRLLMTTQAVDLDHPILGFTHTWINTLARYVKQLHVVTLVAGRHHLVDNVVLHAYGPPGATHNKLSRHWFYHGCFWRLILGGQADAVFIHMIPRWAIAAAPYTKLRGIPLVLWYTHCSSSWQLRLAHHLIDQVVTASPESYPLWGSAKVKVLGHGIDTELFQPNFRDPDEVFRVLSVGRLSPSKQHDVLIEAVRILIQEKGLKNLKMRIVGGPANAQDEIYRQKLHSLVKDYALENYVTFVGPLPYEAVVGEYQHTDLFVNLSHTNSLDKVVLEAMACGVLVVTSNPAFDSLLHEQWLVYHGDYVSLARLIEKMTKMEPSQRRILGLNLREIVRQEHNVDLLAKRLVAEDTCPAEIFL